MAETCISRQKPVLNPIKSKIQAQDFQLNDVNARFLTALRYTLENKKSTQSVRLGAQEKGPQYRIEDIRAGYCIRKLAGADAKIALGAQVASTAMTT